MNIWVVLLSLILLGFNFIDMLWTTVSPNGAGPMSGLICRALWTIIIHLPRTLRKHLLPLMGTLCLVAIMLAWVLLLWLGWWVLFSSDPQSIVHAQSQTPADGWSRAYFTGYNIFTLGIGDYTPTTARWQILTTIASFSGLFLVTLSVTYLLPVLSAATQKRLLANLIRDLGSDPIDMLIKNWTGENFNPLIKHLNTTIWPMIHMHTQRHLAYPVLHYFGAGKPSASLAVNVATLDEVLLILAHGVAPEARPGTWDIGPMRLAIDQMLEVLERRFIRAAKADPPAIDLSPLAEAGIPLADVHLFRAQMIKSSLRRRRMLGLVNDTGWSWDDVIKYTTRHGAA